MSTTKKSLRDRSFDDLIQIYYENVSQTIQQCGSCPEKLFTYADLQDQLRQFGRYGVIRAPILLQIIISDPSNLVNMDELADDAGSQNDDHQSAGMAQFDAKSILVFRHRVSDVLADAKRWGWI